MQSATARSKEQLSPLSPSRMALRCPPAGDEESPCMERSTPEQLLREYGEHARITVYIAAAPGAGKTRRLLTDARRLQTAGKRVAIGWIETKSRPDLERLAEGLPRIPP